MTNYGIYKPMEAMETAMETATAEAAVEAQAAVAAPAHPPMATNPAYDQASLRPPSLSGD